MIILRKVKSTIAVILCIISIFILTGCSNNASTEDTKQKVAQELDYLDTKIISIINQLNNISLQNYEVTSKEVTLGQDKSGGGDSSKTGEGSQSSEQKESSNSQGQSSGESQKSNITTTQMESNTILESDQNNIDWKTIKTEIEEISNTWGVILLDLSSLNVNNDDILGFSRTLDSSVLSIETENKIDTLKNLSSLYSYLPKYEQSISYSTSNQNVKQVKSNLLNAYSFVDQDNWVEVGTNINECAKNFQNILNDVNFVKDNEYKVNKTYILLNELQNSLEYKDKKLFYIKYKNLLESINTL